MNYYVYAYCDYTQSLEVDDILFPGKPFYIGYGCKKRANYHLDEAKSRLNDNLTCGNLLKIRTIQKFLKDGTVPQISILKDGLTKTDAQILEQKLIDHFGRRHDGGILTNIAAGGTGGDTLSCHPKAGNWGDTFDHNGSKNPLYGKFGTNNPKSKRYLFILPDKTCHHVNGGKEFNDFIRHLKISRNVVFDILKGRKPSHQGIVVKVA